MSQQPDKLFRDKLYNYERRLSPDAWNRISLPSKRRPVLRWSAAAATVSLLAVAAVLLLPVNGNKPSPIAAESTKTANRTPQAGDKVPAPSPDSKVTGDENPQLAIASSDAKKNEEKKHTTGRGERVPAPKTTDTLELRIPSVVDYNSEPVAHVAVRDSIGNVAVMHPQVTSARKTVTIVLSAELVNEKYLMKKQVPEATAPAKEASTLRKVLDIAYELKHNQDPIGDLRQKKDQILAFNFGRGKERNEN